MSTAKQRIKAATPRNKAVDDTIARLGSTYFAWVRERIGVPKEKVDTGAATVAD